MITKDDQVNDQNDFKTTPCFSQTKNGNKYFIFQALQMQFFFKLKIIKFQTS